MKWKLREEVHLQPSSTLKKFKNTSKELKFAGNKIQFLFNVDINESKLPIRSSGLTAPTGEQIRIADTSVGWWNTVKQYESVDIASDCDDYKD